MTFDVTRIAAFIMTIGAMAIAGCGDSPKVVQEDRPSLATERQSSPRPWADVPLHRPSKADRTNLPPLVRANNDLGLKLYDRMHHQDGNFVVSPACLTAGLALLETGANGETAREIARAMQRPDGVMRDDLAVAAFVQDLNADGPEQSFQIRLANALWVQEGYPLLDAYTARLRDVFAVENPAVNFASRPADACRIINEWTETRTSGKIGAMLTPSEISAPTRMVLTSALDFRANWTQYFVQKDTKWEPFEIKLGEPVDVPMMNFHSSFHIHGYFENETVQVLSIPCGTDLELAMVAVLPRKRGGLAEVEASLTREMIESWCSGFRRPDEITIALPRFRIRANTRLDPILKSLGMSRTFGDLADFSGINGKPSDLRIAELRQAAVIEVDEKGIEAAAAMQAISPDSLGEEPPVFRADHPFLFLVRDNRTGCILFIGRVVNPAEEPGESSAHHAASIIPNSSWRRFTRASPELRGQVFPPRS